MNDPTPPYIPPRPYIPASLSEIYDLLGSMVLDAPTFIDQSGSFPDRNVESRFHQLAGGFELVKAKLGETRYASLVELAAQAKALFADDLEDTNGKTDQGRALLFEIEDIIQATRAERTKERLPDEEGNVTGD
ncbi:hypothetical protein HNP52_002703 [Sphingomonas kyeonggiensis]|uniref:HPt domain-containing protein n=1 Tax=Sphingomonas kyeonggiensis TaxID=1268553 RepID=A0A7W7K282_9SPHN|nr:hypothetical protein [Sphingomonas kyeonggiensis]MBB4839634.1 hypothetical protein [Sphingomonas kyeonggiensis]